MKENSEGPASPAEVQLNPAITGFAFAGTPAAVAHCTVHKFIAHSFPNPKRLVSEFIHAFRFPKLRPRKRGGGAAPSGGLQKVHRAEISCPLKMRLAMIEVPPNSGFAKDFVKP